MRLSSRIHRWVSVLGMSRSGNARRCPRAPSSSSRKVTRGSFSCEVPGSSRSARSRTWMASVVASKNCRMKGWPLASRTRSSRSVKPSAPSYRLVSRVAHTSSEGRWVTALTRSLTMRALMVRGSISRSHRRFCASPAHSSMVLRNSVTTQLVSKGSPKTVVAKAAISPERSPEELWFAVLEMSGVVPRVAEVPTGVILPSGRSHSSVVCVSALLPRSGQYDFRARPSRRSNMATSVPWAPS